MSLEGPLEHWLCLPLLAKGCQPWGRFIIFVLENMLLQVVQVILLLVVLLSVGFGDAVMYDGAFICFKYYEDDLGCC